MISTKDYTSLPGKNSLETICKAISVLDAILCQDWQYRYYSFNSKWDANERCLHMRNGSGDEMYVLFQNDGCAINGFAHEYQQQDKSKLTIGTTFCLWTTGLKHWQVGQLESFEDNSEEMLNIFDGTPQAYIDWATDYYELDILSLETVSKIYNGQPCASEQLKNAYSAAY